jgi:twinfilin-like protein
VPDACIQMLYASTRNSVTKSLGSASFTDSIFATSKADLTPEAYVRHKVSLAAPKPLSPREQELADLAAAEKKSAGSTYQGSAALLNHHRTAVGMKWSEELEDALKELGSDNSSRLLVVVS